MTTLTRWHSLVCATLIGMGCFGPERPDSSETPVDTAVGDDPSVESVSCADAPTVVGQIIERSCASCHGEFSPGNGGFSTIQDVDAMVDSFHVIPGYPEASSIYYRSANGDMPQGASAEKLTDYELDAMYQWISCGAEDWVEEADRVFISLDDEMDIIEADLRASFEDGTEIDIRYFRLTHLYNADVQTKTIQTQTGHRQDDQLFGSEYQ